MRVVLYTGKGGVGKTTTAAATAACASARGLRTLVVSADPAHSLGDVLGVRLGADPTVLTPTLDAIEIDARVELGRHWGRIRDYLVALFRYQGIEDVVAEELALLPGAEELTTLVAVDTFARRGDHDLIVVDCAPTASTLRLVTLPDVASGAVRILLRIQRVIAQAVTPLAASLTPIPLPDAGVFRDAEKLLFRTLEQLRVLLTSPDTTTRLVVTPERMVIDEASRAFTELSLFGLQCDAVVMNRLLPAVAAAEPHFREWVRIGGERLAEVETRFAPLAVLSAPLEEDEVVGLPRLTALGEAIFAGRSPAAKLGPESRVRFVRAASGYRVHLPLPGASASDLDVAVVDGALVVTTPTRRRALELPPRIAAGVLAGAKLDGGELVVQFDAPRAGRGVR